MGFKRTSAGRVFFKNPENQAKGRGVSDSVSAASNDQKKESSGQATQTQILTLLVALNDKLKDAQVDRSKMNKELETYRMLVEDLENRSERSEQAHIDLKQKLAHKESSAEGQTLKAAKLAQETLKELGDTRKLVLELENRAERSDKGVLSLKSQMGQTKKISVALSQKQDTLGNKLEETVSKHAMLVRKMDQAIEDRVRFMRKIERIEEAVVQTRDSLNAKAMVLLTDKDAAGYSGPVQGKQILAATSHENDLVFPGKKNQGKDKDQSREINIDGLPVRQRHTGIRATGIAVILIGGILGGWFIGEMQKPQMPDFSAYRISDFMQSDKTEQESDAAQTITRQEEPVITQDWSVKEDTSAFAEEMPMPTYELPIHAQYDIGTLDLEDEQAVLALLEENPDMVATELNKIEPGKGHEESAKLEPVAHASASPVQTSQRIEKEIPPSQPSPAIIPAQKSNIPDIEINSDPPSPSLLRSQNPSDTIKPDNNLPDVIKEIEQKAFEGSPEAQHDLAAIYTAGHGGVKQDYRRAALWFEQAAMAGVANARYNLGVLYHQGMGVEASIDKAIKWYIAASELGHPEAQYNLGIAFIEGIGVNYDPEKASMYFEKAAEGGVMEAAYNLGLIYENGLLGSAKPDEALMWYGEAADRGSPEAKAALEQLAKAIGINIKEVNSLVKSMRSSKKSAENKKPENNAIVQTTRPSPTLKQVNKQPEQELIHEPVYQAPQPQQKVSFMGEQKQTLVAKIQGNLILMGLYPGPADGINNPLTRDAIRSYQALHNMIINGMPTGHLFAHMQTNIESFGELGSREE